MYITIEGPIGVGKSTLTSILAEEFNYKRISEIVEENPFLERFYEDSKRWSFQTEMFFLSHRYAQLSTLNTKYLANDIKVVADYNIHKNLIFARRTLGINEYQKLEHIFEILTADLPVADLVVFLTASLDTLIYRIKLRGREFEEDIDLDYLSYLIDAYNEYIIYCQSKFPNNVIVFDCDQQDFVNDTSFRANIIAEIRNKITLLES